MPHPSLRKTASPLSVSGKFIRIEGIKKRSPVCGANSPPQDRSGFSTNINFGIISVNMEYQRKIRIDPNGTQSPDRASS
jgi:hypothetical protein